MVGALPAEPEVVVGHSGRAESDWGGLRSNRKWSGGPPEVPKCSGSLLEGPEVVRGPTGRDGSGRGPYSKAGSGREALRQGRK